MTAPRGIVLPPSSGRQQPLHRAGRTVAHQTSLGISLTAESTRGTGQNNRVRHRGPRLGPRSTLQAAAPSVAPCLARTRTSSTRSTHTSVSPRGMAALARITFVTMLFEYVSATAGASPTSNAVTGGTICGLQPRLCQGVWNCEEDASPGTEYPCALDLRYTGVSGTIPTELG